MAIFTDVLQIPAVYESLYTTILRTAFLLVLPLMAVAILHENVSQIEARGSYESLFVRLFLVMGLLVIYKPFFYAVTYGSSLLAKSIMSEEEFRQIVQTVFRDIKQNKDFGVFNFFQAAFIDVVTYSTYIIAGIAYHIFIWLRFMFLSLLYVAGPILIVFGIYKKTSGPLSAWLLSLFQVSFWIVTISLLIRISSHMNLVAIYNAEHVNVLFLVIANVFFILLFVFTPAITASLITGASIGLIGTTMIGIATSATYVVMKKVSEEILFKNLKNRFKPKKDE